MSYRRACIFSTLAVAAVLAPAADAQSVISTHSGVIHFFEGAVYLDDHPLESHLGRFPSVPKGAELRTAEGRAEVLLTPDVFLRMGERSAIRMVANDLADTQVEMLTGSAIVDSGEPSTGTSVTLLYKDWRVHFPKKGVYRINSNPPGLCVRQGEAEVFAGATGEPVTVERGMDLPLAGVLVPEQSSEQSSDALSDWASGRNESISADNAIMSQIDEDPAARVLGLDSFTYFPYLGVSSVGAGLYSPYSALGPYQPGFNSIYLPGYTYPPLLLGLVGPGFRTYPPGRIGVSPIGGIITPYPRAPVLRPVPVYPVRPTPIHPAPVHITTPHIGVHVGGHR